MSGKSEEKRISGEADNINKQTNLYSPWSRQSLIKWLVVRV